MARASVVRRGAGADNRIEVQLGAGADNRIEVQLGAGADSRAEVQWRVEVQRVFELRESYRVCHKSDKIFVLNPIFDRRMRRTF